MQAKNRVGFWLWNALFGGLFSLIWVYHGGRAFLIAGAALVVYMVYGLSLSSVTVSDDLQS